jgi:Spy/CpxP family protein refolding chaperone
MTRKCSPLIASALLLCIPPLALAQAGRAAPAAQPWGGNTLAQAIYWLSYDQMVQELDILPDQKEQLDKLRLGAQTRMSEAYKSIDFKDVPPERRSAKYNEVIQRVNEETAKEVEKILLPHQIRRLKQIMTQTRLAQLGYGGGAAALGGDELAAELGLTDEQLAELKKKEEEVRQDLQKKTQEFYKKLQEESREKMFSVLTAAQRKKLDELIGEKFEWKPQPAAVKPGSAKPIDPPSEKK